MAKSIADRIKQVRVNLLLDMPFFGSLALRLEVAENKTVPSSLATDGTYLWYNPDFEWGKLGKLPQWSQADLTMGVLHELCHCVLKHPFRMGNRKALVSIGGAIQPLWMLAIEYPTNDMVKGAGHTLPAEAVWDKKYAGWAAERVYDDLLDKAKANPSKGCACGEQGDGTHQGHLPKGQGAQGQCVQPAPKDAQGNPQGVSEQEWDQAIRQAAQQAKMRGKLPAGLESLIDAITEPKLDWKSLLREFVQTAVDRTDYAWSRPSKPYLSHDVILPGLYGEQAPSFAVAVDTSGSVSDVELAAFAAEMAAIAEEVRPLELHILHCDAAVHKVETFYRGEEARITKFAGRGGTDFNPPFKRIQTDTLDIAALVYLTDLEGPFPDEAPPYPVLWVSTGYWKAVAPFGQTIRLELDT